MVEYIKLVDSNVDGYSTEIDVYLKIEGDPYLTYGVIERTKTIIEQYKSDNEDEWDTDTIVDIVIEYLKTEGYNAEIIKYNYCIEF